MGNIATQAYSQSGRMIPHHKNNYSSNGLSSSEYSSKLADQYFRKLNDVPISPEAASKGIEIANAVALARCFPGPATLVNLATTIGESSQMLISKSEKLSKATKDGSLAWFQIFSGVAGFLGIGKEMIFKSEENFEGVPLLEKLALTGSSVLNIFSMISTSVEKSLLSMVCWNKEDKETSSEHRTSLTSALADRRCIGESLVMATIPWISNVGIIKRLVDVSLSYSAIAEGLDTFEDHGKVLFLPEKYQSPFLQSIVKIISNPLSIFFRETSKAQKYNLCFPFNKMVGFLIGNENDAKGKGQSGIRNYMFKPMFEFLGCKPPLFYLDDKDNLVVEFLGEVPPCKKKEDPANPPTIERERPTVNIGSNRLAAVSS